MSHNRLSFLASSRRFSHVMLSLLATCGSVGLATTGMAIAADDASFDMPGAAELLDSAPAPVEPARVESAPAPVPVSETAPSPDVVPEVVTPAPVANDSQPLPAPGAMSRDASALEGLVEQTRLGTDTPQPSNSAPTLTESTAAGITNRNQIPLQPNELFIDATDYNIGATRSPNQPAVVFAERSTGCERSLAAGQAVPDSLCQAAPITGNVAQSAGSGASYGTASAPQAASRNLLDRVVGQTTAASREYFNRGARALNRLRQGNYRFVFPLTVPAPITSAFGWRIHPISGDQRFHAGTDIGAPLGTPIIAAQAGQVAASEFMQGYGLTVVMNHIDEANRIVEQSLYAHMAHLLVEPGQWVEQGEVIGLVGSTGNSTGPHLHFELRQLTASGWVMVDPGQLLEYTLAQLMNTLNLADTRLDPGVLAKQRAQKIALKASEPKLTDWSDLADLDIQPGRWVAYTVAQVTNVLQPSPTKLTVPTSRFSQIVNLSGLKGIKPWPSPKAEPTEVQPAPANPLTSPQFAPRPEVNRDRIELNSTEFNSLDFNTLEPNRFEVDREVNRLDNVWRSPMVTESAE